MIIKFSSHKLIKVEDGYDVILYMDIQAEEFSKELSHDDYPNNNDILSKSILKYINENLPNIKINIIKVMVAGAVIFTTTMSQLEPISKVANASTFERNYSTSKVKNIIVNRKLLNLTEDAFIIDGVTYAPIREICEALGGKVYYNESSDEVIVVSNNRTLQFAIGDDVCILDGKTKTMPRSILSNHKTMVPVRFLSETFGFDVLWNSKYRAVLIGDFYNMPSDTELENIIPKENLESSVNYSQEDIYWLSRLVHAEASGESYSGKLAVANVILNRVRSNEFPNTIKGVIFDTNYAVQYEPTINGEIYNEPSEESIRATKEALNGNDNSNGCLYFLNPVKSTNNWILKNREYAFTIENHAFYY